MIRWFFRLLPVCVFVWVVRKIEPETFWAEQHSWYMPYKDILVKMEKKDDTSD